MKTFIRIARLIAEIVGWFFILVIGGCAIMMIV
jgi:hypothetical protein